MKRITYTATVLLLSALIISSPAIASTTNSSSAGSLSKQQQAVYEQERADIQKKSMAARKEIVARVNGTEINKYDLLGMMNRVVNAYYKHVKEPSDEITREIRQRALDRLIFEELAIAEAVKQKLQVAPEKVQEVIDNLKMAYKTEEGFQAYLDEIALDEEGLRNRIIRSRLFEGITGREVYQKYRVDPNDIKELYKEYQKSGKLRRADEFYVKEALLMAGKDEAQTKANAEKLLAKIQRNNNTFDKLYLDGTFIVRDMRIKKEKYPLIYELMQEMEIGQLSGIVEDGGQLHIFKVLQKDKARDMTEEEANGFLEDKLMVYAQEKRRAEWMKEIREGANIEILDEELKEK